MNDFERTRELRGRVRALLTAVDQAASRKRPLELWPGSRLVGELKLALFALETGVGNHEFLEPPDPQFEEDQAKNAARWEGSRREAFGEEGDDRLADLRDADPPPGVG